jgi:glycosyltransferase involved in cell wall biosynthesis
LVKNAHKIKTSIDKFTTAMNAQNKNNQSEFITVLMATYQGEKYLEEALNSILSNILDLKMNNIDIKVQLLIVDDGSTDNTANIVQRFVKDHANELETCYIKQENCGQAKSFENATNPIKGSLVLLLDSDDKFLPHKLRRVINASQENPTCGMITHPQLVIDKNGTRTGKVQPRSAQLSNGDVREIAQETARIIAPASSGLCFKTSVFKSIHPSPASGLRPCTSADLYLALAAAIKSPICAIQEPLSEYRKHENGKYFKRLSTLQGIKTQIEFQKKLETHLHLKNPSETNSFFARMKFIDSKMMENKSMFSAIPEWTSLMKITFKERNFKFYYKIAFIVFWTMAFLAPKKICWKMWQKYLKIQSGL